MVPRDISAVDKGLSPSRYEAGINRGKFLEIRRYLLEIKLFFEIGLTDQPTFTHLKLPKTADPTGHAMADLQIRTLAATL
jgi:hypothetical protein